MKPPNRVGAQWWRMVSMRRYRLGAPGMDRNAGSFSGTGRKPREAIPFLPRSRAATYRALLARWGKGWCVSTIWGESRGRSFAL